MKKISLEKFFVWYFSVEQAHFVRNLVTAKLKGIKSNLALKVLTTWLTTVQNLVNWITRTIKNLCVYYQGFFSVKFLTRRMLISKRFFWNEFFESKMARKKLLVYLSPVLAQVFALRFDSLRRNTWLLALPRDHISVFNTSSPYNQSFDVKLMFIYLNYFLHHLQLN